ncbi:hypothetical protein P43SY_002499 [Pythium insidiosum]|uniref:Uncharacterized protein n=1 Tax=Pythium insidiosum TaxID=114742 RepID=A0AAD5Q763_PYTIN|nr:hypothetical protein P43SY_002499 [Pythium insidiosum]
MADDAPEIAPDDGAAAAEAAAAAAAEAEAAARQAIMEGLSRLDRAMDDSGFAFTALDVEGKELATLEPIRGFPHLQFVNVTKNQLSDVAPLGDLPYLVDVNLAENAFTTPPAFSNPYLQESERTSTSASSLKINDNQLETLAGLSGLPSLVALEASRNNVTDLAALPTESMNKLERLELNQNKLLSLAGIESVPTLTYLSVSENNLDSMDAIEKLSSLEKLSELNLSQNPVVDSENYRLQMLIMLPHLQKLDGELVTEADRLAAVALKREREAAEAAAAAENTES